jgi:hypothetical protein
VSDQPLFWKGNQDPSITETITSNGLPVDLTGMSVKFKMRAVNSSTLKVDAAVSNTPDATGVVRYDWSAPDVNTAGQFLMWWEVTDTQGHTQDMSEAVIEFRAHTPLTNGYVELEQFKSTAELTGSSFADQDIQNAIVSASRWIDYETSTKFWPDTVDQTRYFTANGASVLRIDDLISLTTLTTDTDDNGTFDYTWTVNTDFVLEPKNAVQNGFPYNSIRRLRSGAYQWPGYPDGVKIVGKFGWAAPPAPVVTATTMLAARLLKRMREAPFGVAGFDATGATVRISNTDPDVARMIAPYSRRPLFA